MADDLCACGRPATTDVIVYWQIGPERCRYCTPCAARASSQPWVEIVKKRGRKPRILAAEGPDQTDGGGDG